MTPAPVVEVSDDAWLARRAREGDRAAFARLYERYSRMVHGILLARVPAFLDFRQPKPAHTQTRLYALAPCAFGISEGRPFPPQ